MARTSSTIRQCSFRFGYHFVRLHIYVLDHLKMYFRFFKSIFYLFVHTKVSVSVFGIFGRNFLFIIFNNIVADACFIDYTCAVTTWKTFSSHLLPIKLILLIEALHFFYLHFFFVYLIIMIMLTWFGVVGASSGRFIYLVILLSNAVRDDTARVIIKQNYLTIREKWRSIPCVFIYLFLIIITFKVFNNSS